MNGNATLRFGDEVLGLKFGLPSLQMIETKRQSLNTTLNIGEAYSWFLLAYYAYAAYVNDRISKEKEKEIKYTFEDFNDYFESNLGDETLSEDIKSFMAVYHESVNVVTENNKKHEEKKMKAQPKSPKIGKK